MKEPYAIATVHKSTARRTRYAHVGLQAGSAGSLGKEVCEAMPVARSGCLRIIGAPAAGLALHAAVFETM